jgi:arylsulfatase
MITNTLKQHLLLVLRLMRRMALMSAVSVCVAAQSANARPNIILILADDLGFSDIGCYGGEVRTPNLDALAAKGLRFTQFYNAARCCPSRATLMTGLYPHQAHVGDMVDEYARRIRETLNTPAYSDRLNPHAPTIAEALRAAGYHTGLSGKWHLGYRTNEWPVARGFDRSFAVIEGAMNYYGFGMQHTGVITNPPMALDGEVFLPPREGFFATDAFTDFAVRFVQEQAGKPEPFFLYLAYTAPHWPLHARSETIAKYRGSYKETGWDKLREQRLARLRAAGIVDARWPLAPRPDNVRPWSDVPEQRREQWDEEMSVYAAQIEEMDQGIGRVLDALRKSGAYANTVVMFMSDNGGASEDPNRSLPGAVLGTRESYKGYGPAGAHVSSSPFRKTKKFSHEGGIATPLIMSWPDGLADKAHGRLVRDISHFIDILPTCLDLAGPKFPAQWNGPVTLPPEGVSLVPALRLKRISRTQPVFWEHEGHRAVRDGKWKLVASFNDPWELYDMQADRMELEDLAKSRPAKAKELAAQYDAWAARAGVKPWPVLPQNPPAKKSPAEKPN